MTTETDISGVNLNQCEVELRGVSFEAAKLISEWRDWLDENDPDSATTLAVIQTCAMLRMRRVPYNGWMGHYRVSARIMLEFFDLIDAEADMKRFDGHEALKDFADRYRAQVNDDIRQKAADIRNNAALREAIDRKFDIDKSSGVFPMARGLVQDLELMQAQYQELDEHAQRAYDKAYQLALADLKRADDYLTDPDVQADYNIKIVEKRLAAKLHSALQKAIESIKNDIEIEKSTIAKV